VDGRTITWQELGEELGSYEGWSLRLVIEDRVEKLQSDAEVIDIGDGADLGFALSRRRHSRFGDEADESFNES
jgi:hypothetical protein